MEKAGRRGRHTLDKTIPQLPGLRYKSSSEIVTQKGFPSFFQRIKLEKFLVYTWVSIGLLINECNITCVI